MATPSKSKYDGFHKRKIIMNKYFQIFRRRWYLLFRKKYIIESLKKRKGECRHCSCCEVKIFNKPYQCRYFDKEKKMCQVYNTDKMPRSCFIYPFDEKDKWDEFKDKCGFYW